MMVLAGATTLTSMHQYASIVASVQNRNCDRHHRPINVSNSVYDCHDRLQKTNGKQRVIAGIFGFAS
jgi:hypothetical protein